LTKKIDKKDHSYVEAEKVRRIEKTKKPKKKPEKKPVTPKPVKAPPIRKAVAKKNSKEIDLDLLSQLNYLINPNV
jgi:hypothetical protein